MLSATFDDRGGGANYPVFSADLTRSRAIFRDPEILYIICRTCFTSQGDPDSSFPCGTPQMCNRVTNHGDTSTFSKPASIPIAYVCCSVQRAHLVKAVTKKLISILKNHCFLRLISVLLQLKLLYSIKNKKIISPAALVSVRIRYQIGQVWKKYSYLHD